MKICTKCGKKRKMWRRGLCKTCSMRTFPPKKRMGKKKAVYKPKKRKKLSERSLLIRKLDYAFSRYIRLRNADSEGNVYCFTSGRKIHWKDIQAGHFRSRTTMCTRWDENNVFPQTAYDNIGLCGNLGTYRDRLVEVIGEDKVEEIEYRSKRVFTTTIKEMLEYYTEMIKTVDLERSEIGTIKEGGLVIAILNEGYVCKFRDGLRLIKFK